MTSFEIGITMFAGTMVMLVMRVPVALAMVVAGVCGYAAITGWGPALNNLKTLTFSKLSSYTLSVIPFFLLMGEFATKGGLNRRLFQAARAWLGHLRGGLGLATISGCAAFGALSGSSIATAATMSRVAGDEMRRQGYDGGLVTGTLAAGGCLGILIPPSIILVIYAIYTEQSIGHLFIAAIIPGILAIGGYMAVVLIWTWVSPASAPQAPRIPWRQAIRESRDMWPAFLVFFLVVGGIYGGWFSPTEAAGIGATAVGLIAVLSGGMRMKGVAEAIMGTAVTSAMIFFILIGAEVFSAALALSRMPASLSEAIAGLEASPVVILLAMLLLYLVLGCVMESLAMVLLTLPVFIPVMLALDFGLSPQAVMVWFGILVLIAVEFGMISPPFGLNLFVINGIMKDVPMTETYKGVLGFCLSDALRLLLIVAFPALALWLPGLS